MEKNTDLNNSSRVETLDFKTAYNFLTFFKLSKWRVPIVIGVVQTLLVLFLTSKYIKRMMMQIQLKRCTYCYVFSIVLSMSPWCIPILSDGPAPATHKRPTQQTNLNMAFFVLQYFVCITT